MDCLISEWNIVSSTILNIYSCHLEFQLTFRKIENNNFGLARQDFFAFKQPGFLDFINLKYAFHIRKRDPVFDPYGLWVIQAKAFDLSYNTPFTLFANTQNLWDSL